jgi:hypothetical protein
MSAVEGGSRPTPEVLREVNERIAEIGWNVEETATLDFLCECSDPNCVETISLTRAEYVERRTQGWVVVEGHSAPPPLAA